MILRKLAVLAIPTMACAYALFLLTWSLPAQAQSKYYAPPLSYSNAELTRRDFSGQMLRSAEFSNANMELSDFSNADLRGAIMSASVMVKANLHGADLAYAMADQVNFTNADLSDTVFSEAILLRSIFDDVNIAGADFTDAILDGFQVKQLCKQAVGINSKTGVATRDSLGCK